MYRIKCSNGKYVSKTNYGNSIDFTKKGKVWQSENLVNKNLKLCLECVKNSKCDHYKDLTFKIETINL